MTYKRIDTIVWSQHAWRNRLQSSLLLIVMAGFTTLLGYLLWGGNGILILLLICTIGVVFIPTYSPWLMMRMYGAEPIATHQAPALWAVLKQLSERASLASIPVLFYIPSQAPNAFAMGSKNRSMIAISDGLLRRLTLNELASVIAHEVSHIRSDDLWIMGLADMFSRTTTLLSLIGQFFLVITLPMLLVADVAINWFVIVLLILAPVISMLTQQALSRTREFDADLNAARLMGDPDGLATALLKLENYQTGWLTRIFMRGHRNSAPSSLRSHPLTQERVARLMELKPNPPQSEVIPRFSLELDTSALFGKPVDRSPRWHINGLWY